MRILFNTPNYHHPQSGGVANHYYGLKDYWQEDVKYNIVGSRHKPGTGKYWLPIDIIKFVFKILVWQPDMIVLNPSLAPNAIKRDSLFLKIAKIFHKKVIAFFHGFNIYYVPKINPLDFVNTFGKANAIIVLSKQAKDILIGWGVKVPIFLTTTKVDDRLISNFNIKIRSGKINDILYLARVEKEKGIFLTLDIFALVEHEYPNIQFTVVGDGSDLESAKEYAQKLDIKNICFKGNLMGSQLIDAFTNADLYLFTSFHEGMPTSVLEAMAFGLPVVSRPVGGLVDFFENDKMGYLVDSFEPMDFLPAIKYLISNPEKVYKIMEYNHQYGKENFLASKVASKMEKLISKVINL